LIINQFYSFSLLKSPIATQVNKILRAAFAAIDPEKVVKQHLNLEKDILWINNHKIRLTQFSRIFIIGFGKASIPMTKAAIEVLGCFVSKAITITKDKSCKLWGQSIVQDNCEIDISIFKGTHPIPSTKNVIASTEILKLLRNLTSKDLVIFLISGGGSALLTLPVEGVSLSDLQKLTQILLSCGADINEINCLRKHLSQLKGGGLAKIAYPAKVISLIISDVVGDQFDVIASGPTVPDSSTFSDVSRILNKYQIQDKLPDTVINHLYKGINGEIIDTPKQGDPIFDHVFNIIIANNLQAINAAQKTAKIVGFKSNILTNCLQGESSDVGKTLAAIADQAVMSRKRITIPFCYIVGGETTVTIKGNGYGGRNLELALSAVHPLSNMNNIIFISLATDGDDGPTDAAGAVVTGETLSRGQKIGLEPENFLVNNNSYHYFSPLDDLLKIGPTYTNVGDLIFIFFY
jgi:hydroxypyruvate reductase